MKITLNLKQTSLLLLLATSQVSTQAVANDGSSFGSFMKNIYSSVKPAQPQVEEEIVVIEPVVNIDNLFPELSVNNISFIQTIIIPMDIDRDMFIDVSVLDEFINETSPHARHYPPNFATKTQQYHTKEQVESFVKWIAKFADNENASYEVLMRAAKLNGIARNLDMGSEYAVQGSNYVNRAVQSHPEDLEANLLYGIMLSEGGAFKTSLKYLDAAVLAGSIEAEQTIAQADIMNDKREDALARLQVLQEKAPNNIQIAKQINIIEQGKFRIWDLPVTN